MIWEKNLSASAQLSTIIQDYSETNSPHSCHYLTAEAFIVSWRTLLDVWGKWTHAFFILHRLSCSISEHWTHSTQHIITVLIFILDSQRALSFKSTNILIIVVVYWCGLWQWNIFLHNHILFLEKVNPFLFIFSKWITGAHWGEIQ